MVGIVGNVILALIVPIAWGLGSAWLFDKARARRQRATKTDESRCENDL